LDRARCLLVLVSLSGCVQRERLNLNCQWSGDTARPIDPRSPAGQRHLRDDAELAEELAIRHGDSYRAREGLETARRQRSACVAVLFETIARTHGVTPDQIAQAREARDWRVDLAVVLLPVAVLFGAAAYVLSGLPDRRFSADERVPRLVATLLVSVVASAVGVLIGEMWASLVEMIRFNDSHLSFRAARIPWGRHRASLFAGAVLLFWLVALLRATWRSRVVRAGLQDVEAARLRRDGRRIEDLHG
jgi:hypothetical protein